MKDKLKDFVEVYKNRTKRKEVTTVKDIMVQINREIYFKKQHNSSKKTKKNNVA